jgi:uncharacterized repeat protein (TIGR03803 family)
VIAFSLLDAVWGVQLNRLLTQFLRAAGVVSLAAILVPARASAQNPAIKVTTIHVFDGNDGANPSLETLAQAQDGNLYGTAATGALNKLGGTIFRLAPSGNLTVLHVFAGFDGWHPAAGLVLGADGLLYGDTRSRGSYFPNDGSIFSISTDGIFSSLDALDLHYANPSAPLIQGSDGNFYGTSPGKGGLTTPGSIFRVTPSGQLQVVHAFDADHDGSNPIAGLILGTDGAFYGTAANGGAFRCGTIFRMSPGGFLSTVHSFAWFDGCNPLGALLLADDGNFYGTTYAGGVHGFGTVFQMTPAGKLTTLWSFNVFDGASPYAGLLQATDGKLYGTTDSGSEGNYGLVFSITKSGQFTVIQRFDHFHGSGPEGGLVQHTNGLLYGTTTFGGLTNHGTIYSIDLGLGPFIKTVPSAGTVGAPIGILGAGFSSAFAVAFNGTPASFNIVSDTYITATVPSGATTGLVQIRTTTGPLHSNVNFQVLP